MDAINHIIILEKCTPNSFEHFNLFLHQKKCQLTTKKVSTNYRSRNYFYSHLKSGIITAIICNDYKKSSQKSNATIAASMTKMIPIFSLFLGRQPDSGLYIRPYPGSRQCRETGKSTINDDFS